MPPAAINLTKGDGGFLVGQLAEILPLYLEVYDEPPYSLGPIDQPDVFLDRTHRQAERPGFRAVTARDPAGALVGFSFGLPSATGQWLSSATTEPPEGMLSATRFFVVELVVQGSWRNQGVGRAMLDTLLGDCTEEYAVLTAVPYVPARAIYEHWGWTQVGLSALDGDLAMDILALKLR
jgi:GNAT superfamily N-acetyltransferase